MCPQCCHSGHSEGVRGKASIPDFTLDHLGVGVGNLQTCEDTRQYGLKVMSTEPFGGKEVDSVIHSDRDPSQKRRGLGEEGRERRAEAHREGRG